MAFWEAGSDSDGGLELGPAERLVGLDALEAVVCFFEVALPTVACSTGVEGGG